MLYEVITAVSHFVNRGVSHITNNAIQFLFCDSEGNQWIGTRQGLNMLEARDNRAENFNFQHFFVDIRFTSAVQIDRRIYFGTTGRGSYNFV